MEQNSLKKLGRQILGFIGFSGIGWLIDFTIFNLLNLISDRIGLHNIISSLCGVTFVFIMSTRKTFVQKEGGLSLKWKYLIYVVYQLVLIYAVSKLLVVIDAQLGTWLAGTFFAPYTAVLAKILITPVTMVINFIVMKLLIERI